MRLILEFARTHPGASLGMLVCLLIAGAAEGIGISALLPLVTLASGGGQAGIAENGSNLERAVAALFQRFNIPLTLEGLLAVISGAFILKGALVLLSRRQIGYTVARVMTELRLRMVKALLQSSWNYYVQQRVGTFANAYSMEVRRSAKAYMDATLLVSLSIEVTVYLAVALLASWQVTIAAIAVGVTVLGLLGRLIRIGRKAGTRQTHLFTELSERLTDLMQGVKPLKAMAREDRVAPMLEQGTLRMQKAMRKEVLSREALKALQEPILIPFLALGLIVGVRSLSMEFSTVLVMGMLAVRAFNAMNKAQRRYQKVVVNESAYWSLLATIEGAEKMEERLAEGEEPSLSQGIELRDVSLDYKGTKVLDGLSLEIPAGRITALMGPSGSGKTSLVDIVAGLISPSEGEVRVDGRPLSELDMSAWRRRIGYVPQEMFLLHDTVAMNVALGDPDVSREDIERALQQAHAWDFVSKMSEGVDTVVGERGSALSGGQRQRIAIARAVLHRPWLLILDEATAALDPASEAAVWQAAKELRGEATVLAISHQPALLEVADCIYEIEGGQARMQSVSDQNRDPNGRGSDSGAQ